MRQWHKKTCSKTSSVNFDGTVPIKKRPRTARVEWNEMQYRA